jgi:hypothetical protein
MLDSARTLLAGLVDYAGLFPPAALDMERATASYAAYRDGPESWMLGRFVVPAARLDEMERAAAARLPREGEPWRLSAIAADLARDVDRIADFNARHARGEAGLAVVDAIELRLASPEKAAWAASVIGGALVPYYEIPLGGDLPAFVEAIRAAGGRAKVRTGGVTDDAFPAPARLARFMDACVRAGVPFKATAGLHHPVRGSYRLTYEPGSACATMFGFLNVWTAAALLAAGASAADATRALEEAEPDELRLDADGLAWRGRRLTTAQLARVRERVAIAFGSCSFEEPVSELRGMGWI